MKFPVMSPRDAAKLVANGLVVAKTDQVATNYMADHTRFESDALIVKLGAGLIATQVGMLLAPVTDACVDAAADFIVAKRETWKTKKAAKKAEEA